MPGDAPEGFGAGFLAALVRAGRSAWAGTACGVAAAEAASSTDIDCTFANHGGSTFPGTACVSPGTGAPSPVGSYSPKGDGRYGQADLGGNVLEWTIDWYVSPPMTVCNDCAYLPPTANARVVRGGSFNTTAAAQLTGYRYHQAVVGPSYRSFAFGTRCARAP